MVERLIDVEKVTGSNPVLPTMKILAIETSCDETAFSLIEATGDISSPSFNVLNTSLFSQIDIHKEYGGVFPAVAKREHAKNVVPLLKEVLNKEEKSGSTDLTSEKEELIKEILEREIDLFENIQSFLKENSKPNIDMLAVTYGPGLEPALWVGINFARALSIAWDIPVIPVNHMEGHLTSVLLEEKVAKLPAISLLISGGHTELIHIKDWGKYEVIGKTKDDAIGEAYDKVARMIGFPYPGGPKIAELAKEARDENLTDDAISFPRPMIHTTDLDFSFSGLKTAILYTVQKIDDLNETKKKNIAREFEQAVVDVILKKTSKALDQTGSNTLIVGGGVIANTYIRENLSKLAQNVYFPTQSLSTDNATMIAIAGYIKQFEYEPTVNPEIKAIGNASIEVR